MLVKEFLLPSALLSSSKDRIIQSEEKEVDIGAEEAV
jgi:hypothetical protein